MKKTIISTIVASLLLSTSVIANSKIKSVTEVNHAAIAKGTQDALASQKKLVQEAISSLQFTSDALVALNKKDAKAATANIEKALGKLEVILSAKNSPKLLPIDSQVSIVEFVGTKDDVKKSVDTVKDLLEHNKVQTARALLNSLQSEIDVSVVSLPLVTYPDALKLAAKYIHENKLEKAKNILQIALNTFDTTTTVIPLPLLKATDLINTSALLSKNGKKEDALKYLAAAEDELDVAEALGYVSHSSNTYKSLHKAIKNVRKEIKGKNKAEKLFDELKKELKDFKNKIFSEKSK
ncbi:YfdX family protein [Sulfurimonas paralvinellae]|uniref:YfdX family protein n=1 Tax=Sulfurimonas paralvinellae TaxID=317658 RepID=A0A7M1B652_9BACT|nr:YfdX family protein [Sulfurimonas paralvinellae]QOP45207.1 YfdX family protein [Sulfurimonas paralvinellae]